MQRDGALRRILFVGFTLLLLTLLLFYQEVGGETSPAPTCSPAETARRSSPCRSWLPTSSTRPPAAVDSRGQSSPMGETWRRTTRNINHWRWARPPTPPPDSHLSDQKSVGSPSVTGSGQPHEDEEGRLVEREGEKLDAETNTTNTEPLVLTCSVCKQQLSSAWTLMQHIQVKSVFI